MSMMGELNYFLGLQVKQMDHGTFLHQTKYYKELLKMFEMNKSKKVATSMDNNYYLNAKVKGKSIDQTKYRGIMGSLLYLNTSRLDIIFSVCMCSRYQCCLKESHFSTFDHEIP